MNESTNQTNVIAHQQNRIADLEAKIERLRKVNEQNKAALLLWIEWAETFADKDPAIAKEAQRIRAVIDKQEEDGDE